MVRLVDMVGKVISFLVVATGDEDLVVLVVVMLVGAGMIVAHMIDTTIWTAVDEVVDGEDLTTEETLLIGVEVEVTVVALKELAEAGLVAVVVATAAAVAAAIAAVLAAAVVAAMTDMRGPRGHKDSLINQIPQCLNSRLLLNQGSLLCPQAHVIMHLLELI